LWNNPILVDLLINYDNIAWSDKNLKINVDNKANFGYPDDNRWRLTEASTCWAAAEAAKQFNIFDPSARKAGGKCYGFIVCNGYAWQPGSRTDSS
jgi:hypothetical protein